MKRLMIVLVAFALVGIAFLWRASVPTPSVEFASTREAAKPGIFEQKSVLPLAPVERAILAADVPVEAATVPVAAATIAVEPVEQPSDRTLATALLEVVVVASETGEPVAGASVGLSSMGATVWNDERWGVELLTDGAGSVFAEVPADSRLSVTVEMGEASSGEIVGLLAPGERRRLDMEIVTAETLRVVVRVLAAEDDAPIAKARIAVEDSDDTYTTTAEGLASFDLETSHTWTALVDADGYAARRVELADRQSSGEGKVTVRLRRFAALTVRVLDASGLGLADCNVVLASPDYWILDSTSTYLGSTSDLRWEENSDAFGTAYFGSLPPEVPFAVEIKHKGRSVSEGSEPVTLAAGEAREIEVRIGDGIDIEGRLLDQDGEPVSGHEVWLLPARGEASRPFIGGEDVTAKTTTKREGGFEFRDVAPGSWWVGPGARKIFSRDDLDPDAVVGLPELVVVAPGNPDREVVLHAHRGLTIHGRVVDPNGEPVRNVFVAAGQGSASTDEHGVFRIGPLLPGEYDLWIHPNLTGWAPPERRRVEAGATDIVIELLRGGSLRGVVRDASGRSVSARVLLSRGEDFLTFGEASGGTTEFSGLAPGRYTLVASTSESCAVARDVVVDAGRATEVELALAPAARLTVRYLGQSAYGQFRVWDGDSVVAADGLATGTSATCNVPPGVLRVVMLGNDGREEQIVEVRAGELTEAVFE